MRSLNYVDCSNILITKNSDPIFKDYNISVNGQTYKPFEFLKIMKSTKDGARGVGIIEENNELLKVAYTTLKFEQNLVSTGGNKKGFINAKNRLTKEAIDALKAAWDKFYSNNEEKMIILNDGLTFQEASNTSVEMQLNENKNSINNSILDIFGVPTTWNWETFIKTAIMPILKTIDRRCVAAPDNSQLEFAAKNNLGHPRLGGPAGRWSVRGFQRGIEIPFGTFFGPFLSLHKNER